ncbi:MAG: aldo/keto reductase [Beijerinckiaceae bacterium]
MKYRRLGKTGLQVSEISFGTGDNAGLMMNAAAPERERTLARAIDLGINFFDTSPDYGKGVAETNLGAGLKQVKSDAIVSTKVEIMADDLVDIAGKIERSAEASLKRLQRDCVDVLMIHNPPRRERNPQAAHWLPLTPEDMLGPALEGLERVRKAGKARFFGFTCENAEPDAVKQVLASGSYDAINCWYNMVNPSAGMTMPEGVRFGRNYDDYCGIVTYAGKHDVGVAVIRPLAGGALTFQVAQTGPTARHANAGGIYSRNPESFRPEAERGKAFAFLHRPPRTLPVAAYQFALANNAVSTVIGGYSDFSQLEEIAAAPDCAPLSETELQDIRAVYARNFGLV